MKDIISYFKIKELNRYLRRNYTIEFKDGEIIIKNKIHVYELFKIREYVAKGKIKGVHNIRIEGD